MFDSAAVFYPAILLCTWAIYLTLRNRMQRRAQQELEESREAGLHQPPSLHPIIDCSRCIGCRSCVSACPENNVLGLIRDKAELINPAHCIGHGACKTACPMGAIKLVFGTAERGIDIPLLSPGFETNVAGIYIAGELGGMGLIRNAIEQGRQAVESVAESGRRGIGDQLDILIVGAGPAGISATLAAREKNLRYRTLEQDSLGGTVAHFPRGKIVMTAPVSLPLVGKMNFREISKESLLQFWSGVINRSGIEISFGTRVDSIAPDGNGFVVTTSGGELRTACVLLAIGRRGTPRKLGVPGEDASKVVYRLVDPEQYIGNRVLVVGGGDSALEAAASIAEQPGTRVCISYRSEAFSRAKPKNRDRVAGLEAIGRLEVLLSSKVRQIGEHTVDIEHHGTIVTIDNDAVIVCAGGVLPTPFLKKTGIEVATKHGTE